MSANQHQGRQDDRVVCRHCGRRMVPRLIVYQGEVERTVCPFCAQTYADFQPVSSFWLWVAMIVFVGWLISALIG